MYKVRPEVRDTKAKANKHEKKKSNGIVIIKPRPLLPLTQPRYSRSLAALMSADTSNCSLRLQLPNSADISTRYFGAQAVLQASFERGPDTAPCFPSSFYLLATKSPLASSFPLVTIHPPYAAPCEPTTLASVLALVFVGKCHIVLGNGLSGSWSKFVLRR